ncbi:MAG TPA: helix-turn-helix domain-containing protein [Candidatus Methylacidiphilales bacterium]|jgi:AraC family transcriptional regulator of arabinose operon|nr:helix-turn-helix domain-containing protein [Candidatus Methylacidiphilales bacterium]
MQIPRGATSFTPAASALVAGQLLGTTLRRTFRERGSKDWLLMYTRRGSGFYHFSGGTFASRRGDITLYRPGIFQDYHITPEVGTWDVQYAHFLTRDEWTGWLHWPELFPGCMRLSFTEPALRRRVERTIDEMIQLSNGTLTRSLALGQNCLEKILLWCDTINPRQRDAQFDPRVRRALEHLSAHLREPFSEERLARAAGLSPSRLRHLFRAQVGDSPRHFLEGQRLRRATELLALSRQTIAEIADELGFTNPFYFTLRFKKQTGESPRAFRQRTMSR